MLVEVIKTFRCNLPTKRYNIIKVEVLADYTIIATLKIDLVRTREEQYTFGAFNKLTGIDITDYIDKEEDKSVGLTAQDLYEDFDD